MKKATKKQSEILKHNGNIVVTASPGSGKTFTLVEKIRLVLNNLKSYQGVIAISYTNKASKEVKSRLKNIEMKNSFIGTLDSFYITEIIIPFSKHITGKNIDIDIISDLEEESILDELNSGNPRQTVLNRLIKWLESGEIPLNKSAEIAYFFLNNIPESLNYILARYKYIFIDEYQDCSKSQHNIFRFLISKGMVGFCVGDTKQSIYGYTKKSPEYLRELTSDNKFKHFELSENMRSHPSIVDYSTRLLDENHIITHYSSGESRVKKITVDGDEAGIMYGIEKSLENIKRHYGVEANSKIALLCRKNSTVRRLKEYCNFACKAYLSNPFDKIKNRNRTIDLISKILFAYYEYKDRSLTIIEFCDEFFELLKNDRIKLRNVVSKIFNADEAELSNHIDDIQKYLSLVDGKKLPMHQVSFLKIILYDPEKLEYFKPAKDDEIQIMSFHKAKGLEFEITFLFDNYKYILPAEWENKYTNYDEDLRLHYVALTRASKVCYIMQGNLRYRERHNDLIQAKDSIFLSINGLPSYRKNLFWSKQNIK
ncbi:UvrD-helicase domain-containing protein [Enterococcus hirae]|uniref:UvrD-helicase domain-containing protein n=1 Tax=Enterococcus hirae TaxID=1354 RepID=UPI001A959730|nr:ATP-dependent helicase [Enterococcus hirae]MBO1088845.1 ATP-dependent helicase [Enterococcus hirae]MEB7518223.1 ATP-dependent helicase [Enterococcus hirae]